MTGVNDLTKLVPGFEFLQGLMSNAGAAIPGMGQWVAPTLDPQELDKRIQELKTVQFWLDNNAKLLGVTIQALEVQRMTLSTLQTMNLPLTDLRDALRIKPAPAAAAAAAPSLWGASSPPAAAPFFAPASPPASPARSSPAEADADADADAGRSAAADAPVAIDPMQWWGALTQQFTELAARAVRDHGELARPAAPPPGGPAGQAAGQSSGGAAGSAASTTARKTASSTARKTARKAAAPRAPR